MGLEGLLVAEVGVEAALGEEGFVGAEGNEFSGLEYGDLVGFADGGETVGDDNSSAVLHEFFECLLDVAFAGGVECAGGFIEYEYGGILEKGAGDGNTLALSAGENGAAFAYNSLKPFGEIFNEFEGIGVFCCLPDIFHAGTGSPIEDVVEDGAGEEDGVLGDESDMASQGEDAVVANVAVVDEDASVSNIIKAVEQVGDGAFAATGRSHKGKGLSCWHGDVEVFENGSTFAIGVRKINVFKCYFAFHVSR